MSDKSGIEWTDATWNPVLGCSKVSPGCDNCYAISMSRRIEATGNEAYQGITTEDDWTGLVKCLPERLDQPLRWQKPRRVFVNSMSDLFHPDVPPMFISDVFSVMALAGQHQFQILTKRPGRMAKLLSDSMFRAQVEGGVQKRVADTAGIGSEPSWVADLFVGLPLSNVWLGTSIESDKYTFRSRHLGAIPAAIRFLSLEPLLGPLPSLDLTDIDWVIVGGESGPNARPMSPEWVRDIRDACSHYGIPFFFKQWGGQFPKSRGRELDGRTWDEYPELR